MSGQTTQGTQYTHTNVPDYQKMLQTSAVTDTGTNSQVWQDDVETLIPSPVVQHPPQQSSLTQPVSRRHFQTYTQDTWDTGGGLKGQNYQPSKYGLVVEEMFGRDNLQDYHYDNSYSHYNVGNVGSSVQPSPDSSPVLMRNIFNRAPVENHRSYPNTIRSSEDYEGYGSGGGSVAGSTSGYGSSSSYDHPGGIRISALRNSSEFVEMLSMPKPRSILRNSQSQAGREWATPPPMFVSPHDTISSQGSIKKPVGDLRQWQQQHQEELLHQHIATRALYEKQAAPLDAIVRQLNLKEEDPTRWEPIRRAADNIIREKNMIIEKLRQRVLELEEDLKVAENKLRQAFLAADDKSDIVHQKLKELQYKNAALKTELAETRTKKNTELNHLEEQLGAAEHELQQLRLHAKNKDVDYDQIESKLKMKEREVEEWAQRFQDMKSNHQQLRQKLDSLERYLSDLPTPDESNHNRQEQMVRLRDENTQIKLRADDLDHKLMQARKLLSAQDLHVKDLERQEQGLKERAEGLEHELQRIRKEEETVRNLYRLEQELMDMKQDKERLAVDLEKAKKLLETTHRRLRLTESRQQTDMTEMKERLGQEEEVVEALREEVIEKEQQIEKMKQLVKDLGSQNQDLMGQNLMLKEQMIQFELNTTDDYSRLQRRFMAELGLCFSELQSLVQICLQRARGEDPNMSVLLGVKDVIAESEDDKGAKQEEKGQTIKHWLSKLGELRKEVDGLRATICNQYAEDMGQNLQCATQ